MKRIIVISVALVALIVAVASQGAISQTPSSPTDLKDSISYNDQELAFDKTFECRIMAISVSGQANLRVQDSGHLTMNLVYLPGFNPHISIEVIPTACAPGG